MPEQLFFKIQFRDPSKTKVWEDLDGVTPEGLSYSRLHSVAVREELYRLSQTAIEEEISHKYRAKKTGEKACQN